eukprot:TRINITY_DN4091_c0_g3_i2.p1 TRINITY_DN4091_c0_g3~~TRINITY_DN4091_c0_g3_i2.p1  ORF type:complete len:315 (+),score=107.60 TRINITY_DN4091_c0_g3_i2:144-1088(+)
MSSVLLVVVYFGTLFLAIVGAFLYFRSKPSDEEQPVEAAPPQRRGNEAPVRAAPVARQAENNARPRRGRGALDRMRQERDEPVAPLEPVPAPVDNEGSDDEGGLSSELDEKLAQGVKLSKTEKKQLLKNQKKQEKEEAKKADEAARDEKKRKEESRNEAYRKKEEEREMERKRKIEEEKKKREEEKKEAEAILDQWKDFISVDTTGSVEDDAASESQGLLQQFIDYIKTHKVVILEDLAAEFKLRTQDVLRRVQDLERSGLITGVIDDRGKFIYISPQEMENVAAFIEKRGRVSIHDIVAESNNLINLKGAKKD